MHRHAGAAGRRNRNRKREGVEKKLAHQLILKGSLTVFASPAITAKCAQTASLSTCSESCISSQHTSCLLQHTLWLTVIHFTENMMKYNQSAKEALMLKTIVYRNMSLLKGSCNNNVIQESYHFSYIKVLDELY